MSMAIEHIRSLIAHELAKLNDFMQQTLKDEASLIHDIGSHLINAGGKQLRPMIAFLTAKALNYSNDEILSVAAMLEFFHSATLLHDDVIDESKLRRGKDTAHQIWGNKAAVLVGDYLFSLHTKLLLNLDKLEIIRFMAEISRQIGQGEIQQLLNRRDVQLQEPQYFLIIQAKTSLLFAAGTKIVGMLAQQHQQALYDYGLHLGNSFQLMDDILDYATSAQLMGKNPGDDLADGKLTLPLIHAYQHGNPEQKRLIEQGIKTGHEDDFDLILEIVQKTGGLEYTEQQAKREAALAKQALHPLSASIYKDALLELADYSCHRSH